MTKTNKKYNWRPDLPDHRDFSFALPEDKVTALPDKVDLRAHCSPVETQGQIGSCTGNALAGLVEFLELRKNHGINSFQDVSRLFIYYNERTLEDRVNEDSGATLRDGIKSLNHWGVCREGTWNYSPQNVFLEPSAAAYVEAKSH